MFIRRLILFAMCALLAPMPALAQHAPGMTMSMPMAENPLGIDHVRDGSGTSWLPDASPMQGVMRHRGPWMLMLHGNGFLQFTKAGSPRGDDQFGSVNWLMGMAQRPLRGGQFQFRTMVSLEPATVGRCGYPTLLQTGESCRGTLLHDRQHPHDFFMEVAASYRRAINDSVAFEVYGGPSAEPALGPTAFVHRLSAMPDPVAPISHHWLDSSHISFGVVTGGVYGRTWKAEGSIFNGREPDDRRYDFDLATLDSYSGRIWIMPVPHWIFQFSAGHLKEAEIHPDGDREDVDRVTASATHHRLVNNRLWATTVAWGRNAEEHGSTSALTAETAADITTSDTVFARAEITGKTAGDLVLPLPEAETFTVAKLHGGYTRWVFENRGMRGGIGARAAISILPQQLRSFYGGRTGREFSLFFNVRSQ